MSSSQIWILASLIIASLLVATMIYWPSPSSEKQFIEFLRTNISQPPSETPLFAIHSSGFTDQSTMVRAVFGFFFFIFFVTPFLLKEKTLFSFSFFFVLALSMALFFFLSERQFRKLPSQNTGPINIDIYQDSLVLPLPILFGLAQPEQKRAALETYQELQTLGTHVRLKRLDIAEIGYNPPTRLTGLLGQLYLRTENPRMEFVLGIPDLREEDVARLKQWKTP